MRKVMGENAYNRALTHFSLDAFVKIMMTFITNYFVYNARYEETVNFP